MFLNFIYSTLEKNIEVLKSSFLKFECIPPKHWSEFNHRKLEHRQNLGRQWTIDKNPLQMFGTSFVPAPHPQAVTR